MKLCRHLLGLLGWGISLTRCLYLHRTIQHRKTQTHIHASSGIWTHDPSVQTVKDSTCLRLCSHWDWHTSSINDYNNGIQFIWSL